MSASPFVTYERTVVERRRVAEVTAENIHQIAAIVGGQVDYSGDGPVLVVPRSTGQPWRVKIGSEVGMLSEGQLVNANGFNSQSDWMPAADGEAQS